MRYIGNAMGLDASVMCDCLDRGLDIPKRFRHLLVLDDGFPSLNLPCDGNEKTFNLFANWVRSACPHADMELVCVHVSNWAGISEFIETLKLAGGFDVLLGAIPSANGGLVDSETAIQLLSELKRFRSLDNPLWCYSLVDTTSKELIWKTTLQIGEYIYNSPNYKIGIDEISFFVKDTGLVVFRSTEFTQSELDDAFSVDFIDEKTGNIYRSNTPIRYVTSVYGRDNHNDLPRKLSVQKQLGPDKQYDYIVDSLEKICSASVKTGNPIRWS